MSAGYSGTPLDRKLGLKVALASDLVDVTVCAIDATWSGLKLMVGKEAR